MAVASLSLRAYIPLPFQCCSISLYQYHVGDRTTAWTQKHRALEVPGLTDNAGQLKASVLFHSITLDFEVLFLLYHTPYTRTILMGLEDKSMVANTQHRPGVSIPELAEDYGLSESLLYTLARQGKLPGCRRLGRRFLVLRVEFEEWLRRGAGDERGTIEAGQ